MTGKQLKDFLFIWEAFNFICEWNTGCRIRVKTIQFVDQYSVCKFQSSGVSERIKDFKAKDQKTLSPNLKNYYLRQGYRVASLRFWDWGGGRRIKQNISQISIFVDR